MLVRVSVNSVVDTADTDPTTKFGSKGCPGVGVWGRCLRQAAEFLVGERRIREWIVIRSQGSPLESGGGGIRFMVPPNVPRLSCQRLLARNELSDFL